MALARALKNELRASKPAKKEDITKSPAIKTAGGGNRQYPKKTYNGPNYDQDKDSGKGDAMSFKMGD